MSTLGALLASIYVPACAACDAVLADDDRAPFCARCASSLEANEPACPRCAEPLGGERAIACARCTRTPPPQSATIAPWRYGEALAIALRRLKLGARPDLARALAPLAAPVLAACAVDVIVPVPLHWRRLARRGYDHAELLAVHAAGSIPVTRALRRTRHTRTQAGLSAAERAANVRGAFAITRAGARALQDKRVLVLDDITTTGATLAAACAAIANAGAADVMAFAFARAE
jgi:ComF family protein